MATDRKASLLLSLLLILVTVPAQGADTDTPPTTAEQIAGLQAMCAESAAARADRQAAEPLYVRLGGRDRIVILATDILNRHRINEPIKRTMAGVDVAVTAGHVADFLIAGTGGDVVYKGRTMQDSHAHLELTDGDFLAAGGDVVAAMQEAGYAQPEIDEFLCLLVSLKDQVVLQ